MKKGNAFNANIKCSQQPLSSDKDQVKNLTIVRQQKLEDESYKYQKLWWRRYKSYMHTFFT